jgi:MFS family permease
MSGGKRKPRDIFVRQLTRRSELSRFAPDTYLSQLEDVRSPGKAKDRVLPLTAKQVGNTVEGSVQREGETLRSSSRLLLGISSLWLGLGLLFDGLTTLVLPFHVGTVLGEHHRGSVLGAIGLAGLAAGMLVQPIVGAASDRLQSRWRRRGMIGVGLAATLVALAAFGASRSLVTILLGYTAVQAAAAIAQAGQQGFIPDLVSSQHRGKAAGWKGFMDVGGATLGFVVLGQLLGGRTVWPALGAIAVTLILTFLPTVWLVREPAQPPVPEPTASVLSAFRIDHRRHAMFVRLVASRFLFLLGTFAVGRFFLFFIENRLGLRGDEAAPVAGMLLGTLALLTALAAPLAGWAADRLGRLPPMWIGAAASAIGVLGLVAADSVGWILLSGGLMAVGSAAFSTANWALTADVVPRVESARFFGLANVGTAGAAAAAGLFGPLVDVGNAASPGRGYTALFLGVSVVFVLSGLTIRGLSVPMSQVRPPRRAEPMGAGEAEEEGSSSLT